jgi:endo-1,4-beta-xylanase
MLNRRTMLHMMGAAGAASLIPGTVLAAGPELEPLKDIAKKKGMRFGNAIGNQSDKQNGKRFSDPAYRRLMARECNMIVAENESKWQALQPTPGPHQFAASDEMFSWAKKEGMAIRGHNLIWQSPQWLPTWVNAFDFGAQPAKSAERLLSEHIKMVCQHYGKDIISYDVVNEAISPQTGGVIDNVISKSLGGVVEEIDLAFRLAREHAPGAQLVYNDYMGPGADSAKHRAGVLKLLHDLKSRGTPIDGLGLQSHIGGELPSAGTAAGSEWRKFLDEASGMGLDLLITEFDVNDRKLPADIAERDAGVAAIARDFLDITLSYPRCRDFLLWGMTDNVNWLQTWKDAKRADGLPQRPTPYDSQMRAKPLREVIAQSMRNMPQRAV